MKRIVLITPAMVSLMAYAQCQLPKSAASSDNYNYTQRSNADHSLAFTGTPDSMYVWVSYYAASGSSQGQVSAISACERPSR